MDRDNNNDKINTRKMPKTLLSQLQLQLQLQLLLLHRLCFQLACNHHAPASVACHPRSTVWGGHYEGCPMSWAKVTQSKLCEQLSKCRKFLHSNPRTHTRTPRTPCLLLHLAPSPFSGNVFLSIASLARLSSWQFLFAIKTRQHPAAAIPPYPLPPCALCNREDHL